MDKSIKQEVLRIKLKFEHGDADNHHLDFYDASKSFNGFAKAIAITSHAFLNKGEIRIKGNSISGGRIFLEKSQSGSFEQFITIVYENPIYSGLAASALWDAIKYTWNKVLNNPEDASKTKTMERIEPYFDDLELALETPMFDAHRVIHSDKKMTIDITSPNRKGNIKLDNETLKSVEIQKLDKILTGIKGNVTRYSNISHIGRFFDDILECTIPFDTKDLSQSEKEILSWSLHESNGAHELGKVILKVLPTYSAKSKLKRYTIISVTKADQESN